MEQLTEKEFEECVKVAKKMLKMFDGKNRVGVMTSLLSVLESVLLYNITRYGDAEFELKCIEGMCKLVRNQNITEGTEIRQ